MAILEFDFSSPDQLDVSQPCSAAHVHRGRASHFSSEDAEDSLRLGHFCDRPVCGPMDPHALDYSDACSASSLLLSHHYLPLTSCSLAGGHADVPAWSQNLAPPGLLGPPRASRGRGGCATAPRRRLVLTSSRCHCRLGPPALPPLLRARRRCSASRGPERKSLLCTAPAGGSDGMCA